MVFLGWFGLSVICNNLYVHLIRLTGGFIIQIGYNHLACHYSLWRMAHTQWRSLRDYRRVIDLDYKYGASSRNKFSSPFANNLLTPSDV